MSGSAPPPAVQSPGRAPLPDGERMPYHPPLLRSHGTLRDVTAQLKSGDMRSDVSLKENVVAVTWS